MDKRSAQNLRSIEIAARTPEVNMRPSEKSFDQVRNILGKLDRSIDELRNKRVTPPAPVPTPASTQLIGIGRPAGATPAVPPPNGPMRPNSQFGRATPLRP